MRLRRLLSPFLCAQTIRRTIHGIGRARAKRASDGNPGTAGLTANQFFGLAILVVSAGRGYLLEMAKGFYELLGNA